MAEEKLNMLAEFPAISSKAWKEKIVADSKAPTSIRSSFGALQKASTYSLTIVKKTSKV